MTNTDDDSTLDDYLHRNLKTMPAFRALLRAVEACFYRGMALPEPVLDVGCGDGTFASEAIGVPILAGMDVKFRELSRTDGQESYEAFVQARAQEMPFANSSFGSAVSNSVLEHIPDVDDVVGELGRVLRAGSTLVISVPSEHFLSLLSISRFLRIIGLANLAAVYERFFNRISRHHHCDPPEVWERRLMQAGFEVTRHWYYVSKRAMMALEWGHYLGLPALIARLMTGRWIIVPTNANLWLTEQMVRPYYEKGPCRDGAYIFFVAQKR